MRDVGKNMKSLREQKGLKQEELAEQLFVTRQTISNYENGRSRPDIDMLMKIAEVMETDVNSILYGPPVPEDKRIEKRRLIIMAVVTIVLGLLSEGVVIFFKNHTKSIYAYPDYVYLLYFFAGYCLCPFFCLIAGWTTFQGLGYFGYAKPMKQPWVKYCRWLLIAILLVCGICMLPTAVSCILQMIPPLAHIELPLHPILYKWMNRIIVLTVKYRYGFSILGALLWLFGFPQPKKKRDKSE